MRFPLALLLAVMCTIAAAQNRGGGAGGGVSGGFQRGGAPAGGRPSGGIPGRIQPVIGPPLTNPFLYPTFPQRLAATVSGYWNGTPVFWGSPGTFPGFRGWNGGAGFAGQGGYATPYPVYTGDPYASSNYAPP